MSRKLMEELKLVNSVPTIPTWAQSAALLPMNGIRIVPADLWAVIAERLFDIRAAAAFKNVGFMIRSNSGNSLQQSTWHAELGQDSYNRVSHTWAIPVNELIAAAGYDENLVDDDSLIRWLFVGSEQELRSAVTSALTAK